jgi:hypothetical protein
MVEHRVNVSVPLNKRECGILPPFDKGGARNGGNMSGKNEVRIEDHPEKWVEESIKGFIAESEVNRLVPKRGSDLRRTPGGFCPG